ncbi:multiple RNA-binding domain-containing protein 1 [Purpureocillium lavendulum]|uniref:Multiple RNA-binding domain-containing protein 1 n=1 Tax=Purpureocillium lavendulum TaxID=1247861 RepID=A0AB34FU37_9HYPO|nr:multiple RNA-binding domain-containing protein 1 [Purpureocillium lavendulum]
MSLDHDGARRTKQEALASTSPTSKPPQLLRDRLLAAMQSIATARSLHQIQLELEYDEEESDSDRGDGTSIHFWTAGLQRRAARLSEFAEDEAGKEIHALCVFDDIARSVSSFAASASFQKLGVTPAVRRWARWRWRHAPNLSDRRCLEAVMAYERGVARHQDDRCLRCCAGQGISPQCVIAPTESFPNGQCSNCLFDNVECSCNSRRDAREFVKGADPLPVVDHMAVLELIARLKRPAGASKEHTSMPNKAKMIEVAALQIAQAAKDWGERVSKGGP